VTSASARPREPGARAAQLPRLRRVHSPRAAADDIVLLQPPRAARARHTRTEGDDVHSLGIPRRVSC
jgi:hypothetical protein